MEQTVTLKWHPVAFGEMPKESGTYLVAFSDGTVESYPMDETDIGDGEIRAGAEKGVYWSYAIPHPDM